MAFIPAYNRQNVLTGLARMFLQPFDPATPAALPMDSVALGGAWTAPWSPVGATQEGVTMAFSRETQDIAIEEQYTPVDVKTTSIAFNVQTVLAEDTLKTMLWAYGGGDLTTTAAGMGQPGVDELNVSSELEHFALGFEAENEHGFWRRVLFPDVLSVAEVETVFRRAESQRLYSVSFRSITAPEDVIIRNMTAAATG